MCAIMLYGYIQNGFSLVVVVVVVVSHNTWLWNEKKIPKKNPKREKPFKMSKVIKEFFFLANGHK